MREMITITVIVAIYFIPTITAYVRRHRQKLAILWLNVLAGWTAVGWVGGVVWACTSDVEPPRALVDLPPADPVIPTGPWEYRGPQ